MTDTPQQSEDPSLAGLVSRYLEERQNELAPATREKNRHYLQHWVDALGPEAVISAITQTDLVRARDHLASSRKGSTVNCSLASLKTVLRWAIDRGFSVDDRCLRVRRVKVVKNQRTDAWRNLEQVSQVLQCAAEEDERTAGTRRCSATLLVALGCLLGLRVEEIIMMRWEDLDLDRADPNTGKPNPVAVVCDHDGWQPKDSEVRSIPIQSDLAAILRQWRQPAGYLLEPEKRMPKRGGTKRVYRYDPRKLWERLLCRVEEAGIKRIPMKNMRHSFASNLISAGVSDVLVARWMGHATTAMVHQHYGHLQAYHGDIDRLKLPT